MPPLQVSVMEAAVLAAFPWRSAEDGLIGFAGSNQFLSQFDTIY
jgi:hypothetical protein